MVFSKKAIANEYGTDTVILLAKDNFELKDRI